MRNKESLLLIIIMVVSASLVAFLYSPVVTKNDFGSDGFGLNPGVNYGGKVENSKKKDNSFSIPDRSMAIFTANASNYKTDVGNSFSDVSTGSTLKSSYTISNAINKNGNKSSNPSSGFASMPQSEGGAMNSQSISNQGLLAQNMAGIASAGSETQNLPTANFNSISTESNGFMALVNNISPNLISKSDLQQTKRSDFTVAQSSNSLPIPDGTYYLLFFFFLYLFLKRQWVPKSKRVSPPVPKKEYELQFESRRLS